MSNKDVMRRCNRCEIEKLFNEFYKDRTKKDGLRKICKECNKEQRKVYREANKDALSEQRKVYREANKDALSEQQKVYYEANKDKIAEYKKVYREANKDKIAERRKVYYEANKDKIAEHKKVYYEANKDKIAEHKKVYYEANKDKIAERRKVYREANKDKIAERRKVYNRSFDGRYSLIKSCAKHRGIPFNLTKEEAEAFWNEPCEYCEEEMGGLHLDRVDNNGNYKMANVVSCCYSCNVSKSIKVLGEEWIAPKENNES